jgi:hypothetical protein
MTRAEALGETSLWDLYPGLCYQVVGGTVTTQPLWPWPMNERLKAALVQAGYPPLDLTAQMEELFGPLPAPCRTGAAPEPPDPPEPTPAVVLELAVDGGTTWQPLAEFAARPASLCFRLRESGQTSTRLCLDQPATRQDGRR